MPAWVILVIVFTTSDPDPERAQRIMYRYQTEAACEADRPAVKSQVDKDRVGLAAMVGACLPWEIRK